MNEEYYYKIIKWQALKVLPFTSDQCPLKCSKFTLHKCLNGKCRTYAIQIIQLFKT